VPHLALRDPARERRRGGAIELLLAGWYSHEYQPDFLVRLDNGVTLVLETKGGRNEKAGITAQAAERWVAAVNADGRYGERRYAICRDANLVPGVIDEVLAGR
jgi:type III restriction enzyme